jgi:glycosyltransferase involved in cell wall biosynthesis
MKLSVVMPVYNEQGTVREAVSRVLAVPLEIELICVDDSSTDGSREILTGEQKNSTGFVTKFVAHKFESLGFISFSRASHASHQFDFLKIAEILM